MESISVVYFRRPSRFVLAHGMSGTERRFAEAEARLGFGGVLASLPCRWVNHPHRIAEAEGYPTNAPYDRIIATCSVPCMPCSWIAQTRPGGLILANLRGGFGGGLVRVEVADDGSAVGQFLPDPAAFIL